MNKILITRMGGQILTALWDGSRVVEFELEETQPPLRVGDIYLGLVKDVVKNIRAAFVEVKPGVMCFLPLGAEQLKTLKGGAQIPVVITREAVKTKDAVCSDALTIAGRTLVLVTDHSRIAISSKITKTRERERLKMLLADVSERETVGFIVRTNAAEAADEELLAEADALIREYRRLLQTAQHRTVYSLLREGLPAWLSLLRDFPAGTVTEVITDQEDLFQEIAGRPEILQLFGEEKLRLYTDSYPLQKVYRLEHFLEMALSRRIWLKSGGYLVTDYTEALTVIDVNTGKYDAQKGKEAAVLSTNLEAAVEIAFQLRLRNLSGIILVDFIDMKEPESRELLSNRFREALLPDPGRPILVDFTALGLAELTRRKIRKPLYEQVQGLKGLERLKKIEKGIDENPSRC